VACSPRSARTRSSVAATSVRAADDLENLGRTQAGNEQAKNPAIIAILRTRKGARAGTPLHQTFTFQLRQDERQRVCWLD